MTPDALIATFGIPPHFMGHRIEPETREDAARERLAYIESMRLDPFSIGDDDVELLIAATSMWRSGILDPEEALAMLRPLQEPA
jgi:hypothetical protein